MTFLTPPLPPLPLRDRRRVLLARIFLWGAACISAVIIVFQLLFPTTIHVFDMTAPYAQSNTLIPITSTGTQTRFDAPVIGDVATADLLITLRSDAFVTAASARISRGYTALFAEYVANNASDVPRITTEHSLAPGALIAKNNGVFVLTDTTHMAPVDDLRTFLAKGWSFEKVQHPDGAATAPFERTKAFTLKSTHPLGTVFHLTPSNTFVIVTQNGLAPIAESTLTPLQPIVLASDASLTTQSACTLIPQRRFWFFGTQQFHCRITLTELTALTGTDYRITINGISPEQIASVTYRFHRGFTRANMHDALALFKKRFLALYGITQ